MSNNASKIKKGRHMKFELRREVENLKRKNISILTPMLEAVANSIDANATEITVDIETTDADTDIEALISDAPLYRKRLSEYSVEDNGEGFTTANIESFFTIGSYHKKHIGCLGYGRMTWLAVFEDIEINSCADNKKISFNFNLANGYDRKNVKTEKAELTATHTAVKFCNITKKYRNNSIFANKSSDEDVVQYVLEAIKEHFLIKLCLMGKEGKECIITIRHNSYTQTIDAQNLPSLEKVSFTMKDEKQQNVEFELFYQSFKYKGKWEIFYCANNRTVCKIKNVPLHPIKDTKFIAMLQSDYLNECVNESRTGFEFPENDQIDIIDNQVIIKNLTPVLDKLLITLYPELETSNETSVEDAINEAPHLATYIREDTSIIKTKNRLVENAEKTFKEKKADIRKKFNKILKSKKIDQELEGIIPELSDIQARELGEYIVFRESLIQGLQKLVDKKEKLESYVHNIFMMMKTENNNSDTNAYNNNIWLLDDKFMSYVYAASDIEIFKIQDMIASRNNDKNLKRPDMCMFYSSKGNDKRDAVIVEFKAAGASLGEKRKSLFEISDNIAYIRKLIPDIDQVWGYVITEIDSEFESSLKNQNYTQLFTSDGSLVYHFMNNSPMVYANIYFYSISALLCDARTRNKVFLDILKSTN